MAAVSPSHATDPRALLKTASRLATSQRYPAALATLCQLLDQVDAPAEVYDRGVRALLDLAQDPRLPASLAAGPLRERGAALLLRATFFARLYLGRPEDLRALAEDRRFAEKLPLWSALAWLQPGVPPGPRKDTQARRAAEVFLAHGRPVRAAAALLRAGDPAAAIRCYEGLLAAGPARGRPALSPYERALVHFQIAALSRIGYDEADAPYLRGGDIGSPEIHRHTVAAQGILEQLADDFEGNRQPERAIDVYCILIALGRVSGRFENLAEGFVGCLRLLKQERLTHSALHAYEDFLACCTGAGEHALAAQQAREAAEFLDGCGLPWGDHYRARAAEYFEQASLDPGLDAGRRESLLLQALSLWSGLGAARRAQAVLAQLTAGPPGEPPTGSRLGDPASRAHSRRARYLRLARDYQQALGPLPTASTDGALGSPPPAAAAAAEPDPAFAAPPGLSDRSGELPVWDLDLREWEDAGDPALVAAALLCQRERPLLCRRHALRIGLLTSLGPPWSDEIAVADARRRRVDALGGLLTYEALRPLEVLYQAASEAAGLPGPSPAATATAVDPARPRPGDPGDPGDPGPAAAARAILLAPLLPDPRAPTPAPTPTPIEEALLSPHALATLRRQLIQALSRLPYRRALQLVLFGLRDPEVSVFAQSLEALAQGRYIGSVSLLSRLVQDPAGSAAAPLAAASALDIRRVALVALSRTRDLRAYGILLDVFRSEPEPLRSEAFHLLRYALQSDANSVRPLLLRAIAAAPTAPTTAPLRTLVSE